MTASEIDTFLQSPCDIRSWREGAGGSWREWFADILILFLKEGEAFDGKRPNCDSGWERSLAKGFARLDPSIFNGDRIDWAKMNDVGQRVVDHLCGVRHFASAPAS